MKTIISNSFYPWYGKKPWFITLARMLGIPIITHKRPSIGKDKPMAKVSYETDDALFEFDLVEAIETLNHYASEYKDDEAAQLLDFIAESPDESIKIPEKYDYFGYIALHLLSQEQGLIKCKLCGKTYHPDELKPTTMGYGKSPFSPNPKEKGGIKKLLGKKQKLPGMSGGRGYKCPEGHELISMITWRT